MRAIVTGARGTVGRALVAHLEGQGWAVTPWNRDQVPIDDYGRMEAFVRDVRPDVLFHLALPSRPSGRENEGWLVTEHWSSELAWICRVLDIAFVFASTALVFARSTPGPLRLDTPTDAPEGYGLGKRRAEARVLAQYPAATVVRMGWQIGREAGSNAMGAHVDRVMAELGEIRASTTWLPACSFLEDTAAALARASALGGLRMIDSNRGWSFHAILNALREVWGAPWSVVPIHEEPWDQRLLDDRLVVPPLRDRLPQLPALSGIEPMEAPGVEPVDLASPACALPAVDPAYSGLDPG